MPALAPWRLSSVAARLPGQCEVCRRWGADRLCADCVTRFMPARPRCRSCALPLPAGVERCGECLRDPPPFEHTACVGDYGFPLDRLIAGFKFNAGVELAAPLARRLARAAATTPPPHWVLPVPLSPRRLAERGYNQAWELARRVARDLGLEARADVLHRPADTPHQADLPRAARMKNLRSAFAVDARWRDALRGRRVAIVDDVFTTGATTREAAATLRAAGAAAVDVWVVARTP